MTLYTLTLSLFLVRQRFEGTHWSLTFQDDFPSAHTKSLTHVSSLSTRQHTFFSGCMGSGVYKLLPCVCVLRNQMAHVFCTDTPKYVSLHTGCLSGRGTERHPHVRDHCRLMQREDPDVFLCLSVLLSVLFCLRKSQTQNTQTNTVV